MDFSFDEAQQLFRDSVDRFVAEHYDFETRQRIVATDDGYLPEHWQRFAELGWLALPFPEGYGGLDGTPVDTMIIMESFGRGLVASPYLSSVVVAGHILNRAATEQQKQALLPALSDGSLRLTFAFAEPTSRFDLADVSTTATEDGAGYRLNGYKCVVHYANTAHKVLVSARTTGNQRDPMGVSLFLVDMGASGVSARHYPTIDGQRAADIKLDNVRVDADDLIGDKDHASAFIEETCDHGIAATCAEAVGAMSVLYEMTLEYIKTREQFGKTLGSFQALQHRMVDVFMACELCRSMVYAATCRLTESTAERQCTASAAKVQVGKAGRLVGHEAIQLHGGMGMTDELPIGHYLKRLTMINTMFGDIAYHTARFRRTANYFSL
ncbi:MAG: acyl-CoA dehydrogenase family protein [Gammaproteobacteria bacterium]|jgi:alkylation response protein AidB-like acyl-CoA dehydrogenase|nr:acyl-CoA dehydrogenase family protein [Gammaproteobacteria bacterium]